MSANPAGSLLKSEGLQEKTKPSQKVWESQSDGGPKIRVVVCYRDRPYIKVERCTTKNAMNEDHWVEVPTEGIPKELLSQFVHMASGGTISGI